MKAGLTIRVVDVDDDYLGIEIRGFNERFAGIAKIYAGRYDLSEFATRIAGFPTSPHDERKYEFGSKDPTFAGGYSALRFHCTDKAGHAALHIRLQDEAQGDDAAAASFSFPIIAADVDRFTIELRKMQQEQSGEATLPAAA